ncbi:MAG TPA: hypothetical protein VM656_03240, partial [Pyrinomonadaceae bacterium]|nr:hypothetical protein [Pyrinomonadaceae bacterium]
MSTIRAHEYLAVNAKRKSTAICNRSKLSINAAAPGYDADETLYGRLSGRRVSAVMPQRHGAARRILNHSKWMWS